MRQPGEGMQGAMRRVAVIVLKRRYQCLRLLLHISADTFGEPRARRGRQRGEQCLQGNRGVRFIAAGGTCQHRLQAFGKTEPVKGFGQDAVGTGVLQQLFRCDSARREPDDADAPGSPR